MIIKPFGFYILSCLVPYAGSIPSLGFVSLLVRSWVDPVQVPLGGCGYGRGLWESGGHIRC